MLPYRFSKQADFDLFSILRWTQEQFGESGRIRYQSLIMTAIQDIAAKPDRIGIRRHLELPEGILVYHLHFSRKHIPDRLDRVKRPRHFLLFQLVNDNAIEIVRILHESADLARHLPRINTPPEDE